MDPRAVAARGWIPANEIIALVQSSRLVLARLRSLIVAAIAVIGGIYNQEGLMPSAHLNRREFLSVAAGAAATVGAANTLSLEKPFKKAAPIQATPVVRRNVYQLDPAGPELTAYRNAITQMKAWSAANADDPRGWTYQAAIHGTPASVLKIGRAHV